MANITNPSTEPSLENIALAKQYGALAYNAASSLSILCIEATTELHKMGLVGEDTLKQLTAVAALLGQADDALLQLGVVRSKALYD